MNRCIVIHPTGATELQDFHPVLHQRLRGLGYRRFVIQFVRATTQQMLSSPVYSRLTPSEWHVAESARKLWGRGVGTISIFDEHGEVVDHSPPRGSDVLATDTPDAALPPVSAMSTLEDALASADDRMRELDDSAMGHRLRSLAHHWLYLVDRNDGDSASFDELLAPTFHLEWTDAGIRTREELSAWFRGEADRVLKSRHALDRFEHERTGEGRWSMRLHLTWHGFTRELPQQEIGANTRHEWSVVDDPSDRFPRIETAAMRIVSPAQPRHR